MCGIVGVFAFAASARDELANVGRMRDTMIHRGPDDAGLWEDRACGIALGHRRLSIVDLSTARRQPLSNEDGRVWLTFNAGQPSARAEVIDQLASDHEQRAELGARAQQIARARYSLSAAVDAYVALYEEVAS